MSRVGVIGAGVMGVGVTQDLLAHGHDAVVVDVAEEVLKRAQEEVARQARLSRLLGRQDAATPGAAVYTVDLDALHDTEFVIENVTERWDVKAAVYRELDRICPAECVFAANTSAIPITRIAGATTRPAQVLGIHFMNPVPLKATAEVIKGWHTSDRTLRIALDLLASLGKEGVVVADAPGFVSNRVLMLTVNEAVCLVHEGVASAAEIDRVFRQCFGHPMGPLETADLIGLDTILQSVEVLYECFADGKYRPSPLLRQMVDAGLHGRKSGQGFYQYG